MLIFVRCRAVFTEIDVSERNATDKMRSAPVLDTTSIRVLLNNVPTDAEEQLRTLPNEEDE